MAAYFKKKRKDVKSRSKGCLVLCMILSIMLIVLMGSCTNNDTPSGNPQYNYELIEANSQWHESLASTLSKLKETSTFEYAVALFDIDYDGTPEIIDAIAGGSSGAVNYFAYDMKTGELICEFSGGVFHSEDSDAWCVYFDTEKDCFKTIGNFTTQGGSTVLNRHISELVFDAAQNKYTEKELFYIRYDIEEDLVDDELVESKVTSQHYYCDDKVSISEYNYQYDLFTASHVRIPETGMKLIRWVDVKDKSDDSKQTVENMAEALLSSGQKYIKLANKN